MTAVNLRKMIHIGCKQIGLDNDTRRDLQLVATGKASMSDMTEADLLKMVEALKQRGFKSGFKGAAKGRRAPAPRGDLRFIHVMWRLLGDAGAIDSPGRDGLNAFIRSRFENTWSSVPIDIDALRDHQRIDAVVQALKAMCRRAGVALQ